MAATRHLYTLSEAEVPYIIIICLNMLLWSSQAAMDTSPCSTLSHLLCWDGTQNLIFCMKFEITFWQNWSDGNQKRLIYAIGSLSNHSHTSKEGYEILKQQWVSLLAAYHYNLGTWILSKIGYIAWNLGLVFGRNDIVWTIRGLYMLLEASLIILR